MSEQRMQHSLQATNLSDILERVLDKGIVIAGDIRIQIADIDLLTIKIRLMVASVDKALEMGIDWWQRDTFLSSKAEDAQGQDRISKLEAEVKELKSKA
ncbi:MAG: gas vesicle protein [Elusimicrobiota bacterium]